MRLLPAPQARRAAIDPDRARRRLHARAMMPRSLTARATLAALVSVLIALVIVSVGVDVLVARHLHGSLDRSLRQRGRPMRLLPAPQARRAAVAFAAPHALERERTTDHPTRVAEQQLEQLRLPRAETDLPLAAACA